MEENGPIKDNSLRSWEVYIDPKYWGRGYMIYFHRLNPRNNLGEVVTGVEITNFNYLESEGPEGTGLYMDKAELQRFMDALWNVGFRPTEGTGSAGSLKATQDHLKSVQDVMNRTLTLVEKGWKT